MSPPAIEIIKAHLMAERDIDGCASLSQSIVDALGEGGYQIIQSAKLAEAERLLEEARAEIAAVKSAFADFDNIIGEMVEMIDKDEDLGLARWERLRPKARAAWSRVFPPLSRTGEEG